MDFRPYMRGPRALVIGLAATALTVGSARAQQPVFVKASFGKHASFLREPVLVVYTLYTLTESDVQVIKEPVFPNATLLAADRVDTAGVTNVTINGASYESRVIYRHWLLPLVAGPLQPEPLLFSYKPPKPPPAGATLQDLMNQTDKDQAAAGKGSRVTAQSAPVQLNVLPLPLDGQPVGFSGAVGQFTITAQCDTGVVAGRMAHVTVTVSGWGTLLPGQSPALVWPDGFTGYDVTGTDKALLPPAVSRTTVLAFSTQNPGRKRLPAVVFSYFDPLTAAYRTIRSDSLWIDVAQGTAVPAGAHAHKKSEPSPWLYLGTFLLTVILASWWRRRHSPVAAAPPAPIVEMPLPTGSYKNEPLRAGEVAVAPGRPVALAPVVAITPVEAEPPAQGGQPAQGGPPAHSAPLPADPFASAVAYLASGRYVDFYKALQEELWTALAGPGDPYVGAGPARAHLKTLGWDPDRIGEAMAVFSACAVSMYTPVHLAGEAKGYLEQARAIAGRGERYKSGPGS